MTHVMRESMALEDACKCHFDGDNPVN